MKINEFLKYFSNKNVDVLLNVGNRGDGLIIEGGRTLMNRHKINFKEINFPEISSGKILFVYGCGAFSKPYHHMVERINFYMNKYDQIIILPASFDHKCKEVVDFLKILPNKVIVFCRERYSFKKASKFIPNKENIFLDHDLALHLNYENWKKQGSGTLKAFRIDEEKPGRKFKKLELENSNNDLSHISNGNETKWKSLLEDISKYNEVHTNRAHIAIGSALLGKTTYVYSNRYYKLKGIYEYSLSNLPNTNWIK
jgi:exopolysaccharide biosynthesis predicted pyruvyltransferase EpsI